MKVRLYRGPLDGKILHGQTGDYHLMVVGFKKMSRQQLMEYRTRAFDNMTYIGATPNGGPAYMSTPRPMIQAEYAKTRFIHPDGSVFYEWTGYSRPYGPQ